ncbi:hypothetical protein LJR153_007381 [Paenibacillus sp. LjRoot153]|uniref:hypothetical protein n=1 Tax=Paenibacillus sp. LjRoot153 TaxID=3342270 RepID=UPI003ED006C2
MSEIIQSAASAYYLAYKCLIDKHNEVCEFYNDTFSVYLFPAITNAAFSCELALKSISHSESGKTPKGHDLYKLFNKLSERTRSDFMERTIAAYYFKSEKHGKPHRLSEEEFIELLKSHKDTFTIWRYFYEQRNDADLDFIEAFMFCLNRIEDEYSLYVSNRLSLSNNIKG